MKYFHRDSIVEAWEVTGKVEDLPAEVQKLIKGDCLVFPGVKPGEEVSQTLHKGDFIVAFLGTYWVRPGKDFNQEYLAYDDSELDCTPYEHPAFTRGSDWGGASVIQAIREAMGNPDQPHTYGSRELTELVKEVQVLCRKTP